MNENSSTTQKNSNVKQEAAYYEAHQQELLERYPEQWVAISNQKIIGVAQDPRELLVELKNKGNPLGKVLVKHLTAKEEVWILSRDVISRFGLFIDQLTNRVLLLEKEEVGKLPFPAES